MNSSRLAGIFAAIPDAVTSAAYLIAWMAPLRFGNDLVMSLMLMLLMEFLVVHSGGFIGLTVLSETATRRTKSFAIVGFGAFYMLVVGAVLYGRGVRRHPAAVAGTVR